MKVLLSELLLLLQLCSAAAALLGPSMCSGFDEQAVADLAVQHIGQHHRHGYKFTKHKLLGTHAEQVGEPGAGV